MADPGYPLLEREYDTTHRGAAIAAGQVYNNFDVFISS